MHSSLGFASALALLATLVAAAPPLAPSARSSQVEGLRALDGEWIYVEDRTEGRPSEEQQPSMSGRFTLRVEEGALVLVRRDGEVRIALDGSATEVAGKSTITRYHGAWRDGAFEYVTELVRVSDDSLVGLFRTELRATADGLLARVAVESPATLDSVALYRHPQDIALPAPAEAEIDAMAWLAGAWVGAMRQASIEERWSPPLGGAMLGVSRTVSRGSMVAFEYLRVVERDGGLVYVAQPGGAPPTEFVLTELASARAVFENPRHDYPQRIVYELSAEGRLTASIAHAHGGRPQRFEFTREDG